MMQTKKQSKKIAKVMHEFKAGELKTSAGKTVEERPQAIAIAMSEAGIPKKFMGGSAEDNYTVEFIKNGDRKLVSVVANNPEKAIKLARNTYGYDDYAVGIVKIFKAGGIAGDVLSLQDMEQFRQINEIEYRAKQPTNNILFDNYYLDTSDNSLVLTKSEDLSEDQKTLYAQEFINSLQEAGFNIIDYKKGFTVGDKWIKLFLAKPMEFKNGGEVKVDDEVALGQIYYSASADHNFIIDKIDEDGWIYTHINGEAKSFRNSDVTSPSDFDRYVRDGVFVLIEKKNEGGDLKPKYLNEEDWDDLAMVKSYYDEGNYEGALMYANQLDTIVRDAIPTKIWTKIGGKLVAKNKFKSGGKIHYDSFTYDHEDADGNEHKYEVEYSISPYIAATREQPEEGGYPEIESIKENGVEIEVDDDTYKKIEDAADDYRQDKDYHRGEFAKGGSPGEPKVVEQTALWMYEPPHHDKVYNVYIMDTGSGNSVDFEYGRRGAAMTTGSKVTNVSYSEAKDVYDHLIAEKTKKGYKITSQGGGPDGPGEPPAPAPKKSPKKDPEPKAFEIEIGDEIGNTIPGQWKKNSIVRTGPDAGRVYLLVFPVGSGEKEVRSVSKKDARAKIESGEWVLEKKGNHEFPKDLKEVLESMQGYKVIKATNGLTLYQIDLLEWPDVAILFYVNRGNVVATYSWNKDTLDYPNVYKYHKIADKKADELEAADFVETVIGFALDRVKEDEKLPSEKKAEKEKELAKIPVSDWDGGDTKGEYGYVCFSCDHSDLPSVIQLRMSGRESDFTNEGKEIVYLTKRLTLKVASENDLKPVGVPPSVAVKDILLYIKSTKGIVKDYVKDVIELGNSYYEIYELTENIMGVEPQYAFGEYLPRFIGKKIQEEINSDLTRIEKERIEKEGVKDKEFAEGGNIDSVSAIAERMAILKDMDAENPSDTLKSRIEILKEMGTEILKEKEKTVESEYKKRREKYEELEKNMLDKIKEGRGHIKAKIITTNNSMDTVERYAIADGGGVLQMAKGKKRFGRMLSNVLPDIDKVISVKFYEDGTKKKSYADELEMVQNYLKKNRHPNLWQELGKEYDFSSDKLNEFRRATVGLDHYESWQKASDYDLPRMEQHKTITMQTAGMPKYAQEQLKEAIENGKDYSYHWDCGYDCSVSTKKGEDGKYRGWFSQEFRGTGNGHYWLLISPTQAIFAEND
jgi:predicted DNA-binding WGR domain protein